MATIYLVLYFLLSVGNPSVTEASSVSGDTFKSPF